MFGNWKNEAKNVATFNLWANSEPTAHYDLAFWGLANLSAHNVPNMKAGFRIRIGSGLNQVSESGSVIGIQIRIQEGKNDPQK
jgi:hypothetical protein